MAISSSAKTDTNIHIIPMMKIQNKTEEKKKQPNNNNNNKKRIFGWNGNEYTL